MKVELIFVVVFAIQVAFAAEPAATDVVKRDAVEAAASCLVIHEKSSNDSDKNITCFENVALERTSFESGVCQWKTHGQAKDGVKTVTKFVERCPTSYRASCDRLVLGSDVTAPVKIFLYNKSDLVLARAEKQCLNGGGNWSTQKEVAE